MTSRALVDPYDLVLFDLDGVVYVGEEAVPGAPDALARLRQRGTAVCYVTNNASRSAETVAGLLTRIGVPARPGDVLTSARAAAQLLAERLPSAAPVLVVGAASLADEVAAVGLTPVASADEKPAAVVQGFGPDVGWRLLAEATLAVGDGALWVATNTDRTVPSPRGPVLGNGSLVAAVATATGRQPDVVVGKPRPDLFTTAARRFGARRPLVVGDRLDTDIEGAVRSGYDSVLVLTGVATPRDVLTAGEPARPRYLAADLADLLRDYPRVTAYHDGAACRDWTVRETGGTWLLTGAGEPIDALRALCAAAWRHPEVSLAEICSGSDPARAALAALGLPDAAR